MKTTSTTWSHSPRTSSRTASHTTSAAAGIFTAVHYSFSPPLAFLPTSLTSPAFTSEVLSERRLRFSGLSELIATFPAKPSRSSTARNRRKKSFAATPSPSLPMDLPRRPLSHDTSTRGTRFTTSRILPITSSSSTHRRRHTLFRDASLATSASERSAMKSERAATSNKLSQRWRATGGATDESSQALGGASRSTRASQLWTRPCVPLGAKRMARTYVRGYDPVAVDVSRRHHPLPEIVGG